MRPGALTQAARSAASRQDAAGARATDRPRASRAVREAPAERRASRPTRPPRRLSGPAKGKEYASRTQSAGRPTTKASAGRSFLPGRTPRGVFASGSAAVAAAVALPLRRPFLDREPTPRRAPKPVPAPRPDKSAKPATGMLHGIGAFVLSLPDHSLLDRVVRGRAWIPLLGVLLAGIVAAQVEILKLGASMGRSLEQTTTLTSQNELLRDNVASLSDVQRIERLATSMGMVLPPPGAVGYLTANQRDVTGALNNIHAPSAAAFMALTPSNGALVTGPGASMLPTSSGVLEQAGTPGSATPTTTPSATSTVTPTGTAASSATTPGSTTTTAGSTGTTTGATGTTTGSSGAPTDTTGSQTTPAEEPPPATTTTPATSPTDSQGATTGTQSSPTDSQTPATGAAAIQPAGTTQQSSGG